MMPQPPKTEHVVDDRDASRAAGDAASWGECEILLVADRRAGSTYKFFRSWRLEVAMRRGRPGPGTTLFTVQIDPAELAASGSRYDMVQLANDTALPPRAGAAFSWTRTSTPGSADPIASALAQAQGRLGAAGWTQDRAVATAFSKPDGDRMTRSA